MYFSSLELRAPLFYRMERRRSRRMPANVVLEVHDAGQPLLRGRAQVRNFSLGGMALEGHVSLRSGETVFLKINVPVEFFGKVVYARERADHRTYGVKFSQIGFFDKLRLRRYISAEFKE